MENMIFCQSCAMPLIKSEDFGTNADGNKNEDYCLYCYKEGAFTTEETMEEMIESCIPHVSSGNPYANENEARTSMKEFFPTLKRWK
ncbi:putative zinc ribbon domain protein [Clostridium argentinense CDC 2741]|uniref:Putative zinc ribbon domain protein n=1 Tax=Clostridium argentinense CDC 2741 TaxID=1418104 RepID=A0A0C1R6K3_9CLOT|nr:zinc ribbon domain-containing protein [Clostridium argentinense]ARC85981.1 transcriptional regulator [Clostridium argentinense]KIE46111.1 putative zinc ribbon domain protein [Clostridium argentinense CDC 2741]NFF38915.1 transcriptional regulator [Clostridium argentinense]NFP48707.1 transcriptional regulator [Clostridium argentinense]NFP71025.1 transcriptional regulator [Clostridium argentinense]